MEIDIDNVKSIKFGETKEYDKLHNSVYRVIRITRENGEDVDITLRGKEKDLIFKL